MRVYVFTAVKSMSYDDPIVFLGASEEEAQDKLQDYINKYEAQNNTVEDFDDIFLVSLCSAEL